MNEKNRKIFILNIKYFIKISGMKTSALAKELQANHREVLRWKNGERAPTLVNAAKLANYFGKTIEDLLTTRFYYKKKNTG